MTDGKAIILLHCPDRQGVITDITGFITRNHGNIVYIDQFVDTIGAVLRPHLYGVTNIDIALELDALGDLAVANIKTYD